MTGHNHSEATKLKLSIANLGKIRGPHTEETKRKISLANTGHEVSEETRRKLSENSGRGMLGRHQSDEAKQKISDSQKGENGYWFGKTQSEETRLKRSKALKGRVMSEEHKRKISEAHLARRLSSPD